jgi:type VI protein secretion system component VasK
VDPNIALLVVLVVLGLVALAVTVWALVDVLRTPEPRSASKLIWVILILGTNLLGVLLYAWLGRPRADARLSAR